MRPFDLDRASLAGHQVRLLICASHQLWPWPLSTAHLAVADAAPAAAAVAVTEHAASLATAAAELKTEAMACWIAALESWKHEHEEVMTASSLQQAAALPSAHY